MEVEVDDRDAFIPETRRGKYRERVDIDAERAERGHWTESALHRKKKNQYDQSG
jgi:hypothetical protein